MRGKSLLDRIADHPFWSFIQENDPELARQISRAFFGVRYTGRAYKTVLDWLYYEIKHQRDAEKLQPLPASVIDSPRALAACLADPAIFDAAVAGAPLNDIINMSAAVVRSTWTK